MKKLKFFEDAQEVIDYMSRELLATLRDDLAQCTGRDEAETRRDLKAKIHDIEAIEDDLTLKSGLGFVYVVHRMSAEGSECDVFTDYDLAESWAEALGETVTEEPIIDAKTLREMQRSNHE